MEGRNEIGSIMGLHYKVFERKNKHSDDLVYITCLRKCGSEKKSVIDKMRKEGLGD